MKRSFVRRVALLGAASLVGFLALLAATAAPAFAANRPPSTAVAGHQGVAPRVTEGPVYNELLRQRLAEEDEGEEEEDSPALSALCQSFLGQPNPYPNPAPNVDQIVGDTVVTVGSQAGCNAAQNETTIAVNPSNPNHIVAGANDYRLFNTREGRNDSSSFAYVSFDGGASWTNVAMPGLAFPTGGTGAYNWFDVSGDPVVAFGPNNTVYFGSIAFSRSAPLGGELASAITVNVSHDGGLNWSGPTTVAINGVTPAGQPVVTHFFHDKLWLGADPNSGRLYVTWTKFTYDDDGEYIESPIMVRASEDFGATFGPERRVAPSLSGFTGGITPYNQGSNPQVGNDGTLYVAYEASVCATLACNQPGDRDATVVATSTNHGNTFRQAIVGTNFDFPSTLTKENFRLNSYPQLAYDRATGRLTVVWSDDRNGKYNPSTGRSVRTNGDNIVSSSTDGRTWTSPVVVGTPEDEFFSAVAAHAGRVAITSYTRNYDPTGINLDYAYWTAGSAQALAAAPIQRITTASQNPQVQFIALQPNGQVVQGVFIGDYSAVAIGTDLRIHPCWTDFRGNPALNTPNQDAYTQSIPIG